MAKLYDFITKKYLYDTERTFLPSRKVLVQGDYNKQGSVYKPLPQFKHPMNCRCVSCLPKEPA